MRSKRMTPARLRPRRFWVSEMVQTSAMDCGPASLKCLLEGFHIPVSYGRPWKRWPANWAYKPSK